MKHVRAGFFPSQVAGSLKFVKDQAINCFKISWSLCCRGVFTTFLDVWDRASRENSHQLKTVDCFPRNPRLKCLTEFLLCPCVIRYCPPWKRKIFNNLIFDFLVFFRFICLWYLSVNYVTFKWLIDVLKKLKQKDFPRSWNIYFAKIIPGKY